MSVSFNLEWDKTGEREYEVGVSHGVLYPMSGSSSNGHPCISTDRLPRYQTTSFRHGLHNCPPQHHWAHLKIAW